MQDIKKYSILIKDLVTDQEEWFMVQLAKGGFSVATLPSVVPKQSMGETTAGDLSNTSVFVQYSWAGQSTSEWGGGAVWPSWVKYWTPTYNYSATLPTWSYWYSSGVDVLDQQWEIRLWWEVTEKVSNWTGWDLYRHVVYGTTAYACAPNSWEVYSTTNGYDWTLLTDTWVDKIVNLSVHENERVKALFIHWLVWDETKIFRYSLVDDWYYFGTNPLRAIPSADAVIKAPVNLELTDCPNPVINVSSTEDILNSAEWMMYTLHEDIKVVQFTANDKANMCVGLKRVLVWSSDESIFFINNTISSQLYRAWSDYKFTVPANSIVVRSNQVDWTVVVKAPCKLLTSGYNQCRAWYTASGWLLTVIWVGNWFIIVDAPSVAASLTFDIVSVNRVYDIDDSEYALHGARYTISWRTETIKWHCPWENSDNSSPASTILYIDGISFVVPTGNKCFPCWYPCEDWVVPEHVVFTGIMDSGSAEIVRLQEIQTTFSVQALLHFGNNLVFLSWGKDYNSSYGGITEYSCNAFDVFAFNKYSSDNYWDGRLPWTILNDFYDKHIYKVDDSVKWISYSGISFNSSVTSYSQDRQYAYLTGTDHEWQSAIFVYNKWLYELLAMDPIEDDVRSPFYYNWNVYFHNDRAVLKYDLSKKVITRYWLEDYNLDLRFWFSTGKEYLAVDETWHTQWFDLASWSNVNWFQLPDTHTSSSTRALTINWSTFIYNDWLVLEYDNDAITNKWYVVSSIYWRYMWSVPKTWIRAKMIISEQVSVWDQWQKIRLAVSYDWGKTFFYLWRNIWSPHILDDYDNLIIDPEYEFTWNDFQWEWKDELEFWFPYTPTQSQTICYKVEMFWWGGHSIKNKEKFSVKQIELYYLLNTVKEFFLNFMFDLKPRQELLNRWVEGWPTIHREKYSFLKALWTNQHKCRITMPWWETVYAVPFAAPQSWSDGFVLSANNTEAAKNNLNHLAYLLQMSFKTLEDLDDKNI